MWQFKIARTIVMMLVGYGLIVYWFFADRGPRVELSQALMFGVIIAAVETIMLVQRLRSSDWGGPSPKWRALGCVLGLGVAGGCVYAAVSAGNDGARQVQGTVTTCTSTHIGRRTHSSTCSLRLDDGSTALSAKGTHLGDEGRRVAYVPEEGRLVLPGTDRVTYLVMAGAFGAYAVSGLVGLLVTGLGVEPTTRLDSATTVRMQGPHQY